MAAVVLLALARLWSLAWYPLMDTTEARYADIARRMLERADWVTPWIGDDIPFWGKPPLSFWATEAGFVLFGVTEWGARLPHFLLGVAVAALAWWQARTISHRAAWHTVGLLAGSVLFLVSSGAVMTDMALALGNTMVMVGFWRAWRGDGAGRRAGGLLAAGAAIGLLAKGPVSLVLWGVPVLGWALVGGRFRQAWQRLAWLRGALLVLAITLPWYLMAERRSPGFLQYFIVGEHWHRFVTPGWAGDLYGSAHAFPRGSIWLFAAAAVLPWSLLIPLAAWAGLGGRRARAPDAPPPHEGETSYLLAWALTPCLFFTVAGNILWTYVLPGLPALALLAGRWTASRRRVELAEGVLALGMAIGVIGIAGLVISGSARDRLDGRSAQALVQDYQRHAAPGEGLYFIGKMPFSGAFYSAGQAHPVASLAALPSGRAAWVVLDTRAVAALAPEQRNRLSPVTEHQGRVLARWRDAGADRAGTLRGDGSAVPAL